MLSMARSGRGGLGRRDFLRIGTLSLGGLTLPDLLATRAAAVERGAVVRDKSVIFLFLHGGPSQYETFDPKMDAPAGVRGATGEVATSIPGVTFGGTLGRLASLADRLAIVRSYRSGNGNHDIKPIVCDQTLGANLGSLLSRVAGTNHPTTGMPTNAALFPRAVDPDTQPANNGFGRFDSTGDLGTAYRPFVPGAGGDLQQDLRLSVDPTRLDDRRVLLKGLDRIKESVDSGGVLAGADRFRQQAFQAIVAGIADAFDLSSEDARTVARYDTAPLVRPEAISRQWNNYDNYVDNAKSLGKLLLLARRLVERGCGFVTVTTNFVWDMHADRNNAGVEEGMRYMGPPMDHALSALLEDLRDRGLDDRVMVVATGEMGRTPKINDKGGRDHWGNITPLLLAGGGLRTGQVIGQSTRDGGGPRTRPYGIDELIATIMHSLLDIGELRLVSGLPADIARVLTTRQPIDGLL